MSRDNEQFSKYLRLDISKDTRSFKASSNL